MNTLTFLLTLICSGDPVGQAGSTVYFPESYIVQGVHTARPVGLTEPTLRMVAQNDSNLFLNEPTPTFAPEILPAPEGSVYPGPATVDQGVIAQPPVGQTQSAAPLWDPSQSYQTTYDPFLGPPPGAMPPGTIQVPGVYGPAPYRLGWSSRYEAEFVPSASTSSPLLPSIGWTGANAEWEYVTPINPGWVFGFAQEFNYRRFHDGNFVGFPDNVYRLGWRFSWATIKQAHNPWSFKFVFNPSINTDFKRSLSSRAYHWDGWAIGYYEVSPYMTLALGVGYWDRRSGYVLPYAGVILRPNELWELRLTFPEAKISRFIGHGLFGGATWLYVRGEYHVESYDVHPVIAGTRRNTELEIEDWRVLVGLKKEYSTFDLFVEAGWIFDRKIRMNPVISNWSSDFIGRVGISF